MKIAVLGTGNIGGTLGRKWAAAGHEVKFGVRDMDSPHVQSIRNTAQGNFSFDTHQAAIAFGEVILFAVPGASASEIIEQHASALDGKIIIDATNNLNAPQMSQFAAFAAKTPQAKVYRAFNSLGWENFARPRFGDMQADLFYCGSQDAQAAQTVEQLISDVGLRPISLGGPDQVQVVDSVVRLWFALAIGQKMGRHTAFKVLTGES